MKYVSAAFAARARLANDNAYRALAEKAVAASADNQASFTAIQAELAKVSASLAAVEKVLKQVE
jgi:phage shock protein A